MDIAGREAAVAELTGGFAPRVQTMSLDPNTPDVWHKTILRARSHHVIILAGQPFLRSWRPKCGMIIYCPLLVVNLDHVHLQAVVVDIYRSHSRIMKCEKIIHQAEFQNVHKRKKALTCGERSNGRQCREEVPESAAGPSCLQSASSLHQTPPDSNFSNWSSIWGKDPKTNDMYWHEDQQQPLVQFTDVFWLKSH